MRYLFRRTIKKEELLRPSTREGSQGSHILNSMQITDDSEYVADMTQKLRSLIFSNPNLNVNKEGLAKVRWIKYLISNR